MQVNESIALSCHILNKETCDILKTLIFIKQIVHGRKCNLTHFVIQGGSKLRAINMDDNPVVYYFCVRRDI